LPTTPALDVLARSIPDRAAVVKRCAAPRTCRSCPAGSAVPGVPDCTDYKVKIAAGEELSPAEELKRARELEKEIEERIQRDKEERERKEKEQQQQPQRM